MANINLTSDLSAIKSFYFTETIIRTIFIEGTLLLLCVPIQIYIFTLIVFINEGILSTYPTVYANSPMKFVFF